MHCEPHVDNSARPGMAHAFQIGHLSLLDLCTILSDSGLSTARIRERRYQRRHPNYTKPELMAEAPDQVWSWNISKIRGPV